MLFHRLTGETHFFNLYATFALRSLMERPMSTDGLVQHLVDQLGQPNDEDLLGRSRACFLAFRKWALSKRPQHESEGTFPQ